MWLENRMKQLGLSSTDLGARIGKTKGTIDNWLYKAKRVPLRIEDPDDVKLLATALDWTIVDVLIAIGYDIETVYDKKFIYIIHRLSTLPLAYQDMALKIIHAALETVEELNELD